jgi:hypothetical protein
MPDYREILVEFMLSKSKWMEDYLNIDGDLYCNEEDLNEIRSWDEKTAKKIWYKIKRSINKNKKSGLRYEFCPFCYYNGYRPRTSKTGLHNPVCMKCNYGERHGVCTATKSGTSHHQDILRMFKEHRVNIYKTLSSDHYKRQVQVLEKKIRKI